MRKALSSKLFTTALSLLLSCCVIGQNQLALDNKKLDSITKSYKTYSIRLVVNDSSSSNSLQEIDKELRNKFAFLRNKKRRVHNPDFEVQVEISGKAVGTINYSMTTSYSQYGTYYHHHYLLNHISSTALSIQSNGSELTRISIDSNTLLQRKYSFTESKSNYSWVNDASEVAERRIKDEQAAQKAKTKADELWLFEKDFFDLFKNYVARKG